MDLQIRHNDVGGVLTRAEWEAEGTHQPVTVEELWAILSQFAGMYRHESVAVTTIQDKDDWHVVNGFTEGENGGGWTYHAGEQLALTAQADNGDGKTKITCAGHGLINGDVISISGTNSYDGVWVVEQVAPPDTFVISTAWGADEGDQTGEHGSHFIPTTAGAAGKYLVTYSMSVTPGSPNCVLEAATFLNADQCMKCESQTKLGAASDYQNVAGQSVLDLAVNDIISLAVRNITDNGNFIIRNGNLTIVRIG